MGSKFGRTGSGFGQRSDKEKFLFIAAAGAALAVVVIFVLVTSLKSGAATVIASREVAPAAALQTQASVPLIAAEVDVVKGTKLSDVRFKTVMWPRNQIPEGAFTDPSEVVNLFAKVNLSPGVPVQRMHTTTQDLALNVSTIPLTPGNRAVSIEVDDTSGLEGHALPGTKVDVVLTYSQGGVLQSNIIVQNARVLSYGGDTTPGGSIIKEHRPTKVSRTMTLDVATQDALKIQTARQMGRLSLIMRSPDDDAASSTLQFSGQELQSGTKAVKTTTGVQPAATPCSKGKMRMGGKEYIVGCDGSMNPIE